MRRMILSLFSVLVLLPFASASAQEATDLQSVIEKSVEAAGGLQNLEKVQRHKGREEGTYYGGGDGLPFTATFASDPPDRFRMEIEGVFTIVVDRDKGWTSTGGGTEPMPEEVITEQREEQYIGWVISLVPLVKQKEQYKLTSIEGQEVEGRPTIGIQVESEGHRDVKLYFDKQNHDLLKAEYQVKSAEQGYAEVNQELIIKDYMKVDGAKLPSEMTILRDGQKYVEAKITEIEPVEEFDEESFSEPR